MSKSVKWEEKENQSSVTPHTRKEKAEEEAHLDQN